MCRSRKMNRVLQLLAKNVESNTKPGLVKSNIIADELAISLSETRQILKTMQSMGTIQVSVDADYSLITARGLTSLQAG